MFTGIVEKTGKLKKITKKNSKVYFTIEVKNFLKQTKIGDSLACDGVCLTVVEKTVNNFTVELMPETLRRTKFIDAKIGDEINLEKSLKVGGQLDGHFVLGHVDAVGIVSKVEADGEYTNLIIKVPTEFTKYLAFKGSATINGVSLTIAEAKKNNLKVCLISHTLELTNLKELKKGDKVNLEVDVIARYLEKLLQK